MNEPQPSLSSRFPERRSNHNGTWVALYMEPLVGSGERLCIGVAAADGVSTAVVPVGGLDRLSSVYGRAAGALQWSAELAIIEARDQIAREGLQSLTEWSRRIEGLQIGAARRGAGTGLADLAKLALQQSSSLVATTSPEADEDAQAAGDGASRSPLEQQIKRLVIERRPLLRSSFGRSFRRSQSARALRYGFVGNNVVANFAMLSASSAYAVSTQVDRAKARLWDLKQLDDGILADSLPLGDRATQYELLVNQRALSRAEKRRVPSATPASLKAAEEELEAEADKYKIQVKMMQSPDAIADYIVRRAA